ncbi:MAG: sialidase family protein, partial [Promethearchaeota archaeon]
MTNKNERNKIKPNNHVKYLTLFLLIGFSVILANLSALSIIINHENDINNQNSPRSNNDFNLGKNENNYFDNLKSSINTTTWPLVIEDLSVESNVFSPKNQDGILDSATFSFRTINNVLYNYTIEAYENMTSYTSTYPSVAGNSSELFMVYSDSRDYDGTSSGRSTVYITYSYDYGNTWDSPVETNLSISATGCYYDLKLVHNPLKGHLFLMVTKYYRMYPYVDNYEIAIYKSTDRGVTWSRIAKSDAVLNTFKGDSRKNLNHDFIISNDNSNLYAIITNTSNNLVYFLKSSDGGQTWTSILIASRILSGGIYSPSIAMAPDNTLTVVWWEYSTKHFYMSNSTNLGLTWSTPVILSELQGIGPIGIPYNIGHLSGDNAYESGSFELEYDASGSLNAMFIYNSTKIYSAISKDGGYSWTNVTQFRNLGSSKVYTIDFDILNDGNETIVYSGYLAGLENPGSTFFVTRKIIKRVVNQTAIAGIKEVFYWDGKNESGNYVDDGTYLCVVSLKDLTTNLTYPNKLYQKVRVDNVIKDPGISLDYHYISPQTSENVQDKLSISYFPTDEDLYYNLYVRKQNYQTYDDIRITKNEVGQMAGDVAFDRFNKMHFVYVSYEDNDRNIYYKTSDNFGVSFSVKKELVKSSYFDDCPAIAIHGDDIYIVFMRYHEAITRPNEYVFDLFFIHSEDLGNSWSIPINLTAGEFTGLTMTDYFSPDIITTRNGTIIISYNAHQGPVKNWYIIKSTDKGNTFSSPISIGPESKPSWQSIDYGRPSALAYDYDNDVAFLIYPNKSSSEDTYAIYMRNSTDQGGTWSSSSEAFTMTYNKMIRGVTLDYLGNQTLQMAYYYFDAYYQEGNTYYLKSYNDGANWTNDEFLMGHILEMGTNPSGSQYLEYLRSGVNQLGDIFYVYAYVDSLTNNLDVYGTAITKTIYHSLGSSLEETETRVEWDGNDYWGFVNDGQYNISLIINDAAHNQFTYNSFCVVDNEEPDLFLDIVDTSGMSPTKSQTIAAINNSIFSWDVSVDLYYRYSLSSSWNIVPALFNGTHYVATIPASSNSIVYFYMNATDLAGNSGITEELNYYDISFNLSPQTVHFTPSSKDPERKLDDTMEFSVTGLDWDKVKAVYLNYTLNDGNSTIVKMSFVNEEKYVYTLKGSQQYYKLEYEIIVEDIKNQNHTYAITGENAITQEYIPVFPEINIGYPLNLYIVLGSTIVGIISAMFTTISRNREFKKIKSKFKENMELYVKQFKKLPQSGDTSIKKTTESANKEEKEGKWEEIVQLPESRKTKGVSEKQIVTVKPSTKVVSEKSFLEMEYALRGKHIFFIGLIGTISCIVIAFLSLSGVVSATTGLLIAALGLLLSTLTLMEKILIDINEGIYNNKISSKLPIIIIIGLMGVTLALFMSAGRLIDWFNYYIVQDTFTIGSFEIPNLWLSLTTPFLSIIMFITITTYKNLNATMKEMEALTKAGQNWKDIWTTK